MTDAPSAERFRRAGVTHVRAANLYGLDRHFAAAIDQPDGERDIDVLFAGNFHPAIQGRLPWIGRIAALGKQVQGGRYNRCVRYRVPDPLTPRQGGVQSRAIRGECNLRALEAAASSAVLLQEAENTEVPEYLQPNREYAPSTADTLEQIIERLLTTDDQRRVMADAARTRVRGQTYEALIRTALDVGGSDWEDVTERAPPASAADRHNSLAGPRLATGLAGLP